LGSAASRCKADEEGKPGRVWFEENASRFVLGGLETQPISRRRGTRRAGFGSQIVMAGKLSRARPDKRKK
jgi:hypothetical protein